MAGCKGFSARAGRRPRSTTGARHVCFLRAAARSVQNPPLPTAPPAASPPSDPATLSHPYPLLMRQDYWFATAPAAFQQGVLRLAQLKRLAPGQTLFSRGDPPNGLYCVLEGALRVSGLTEAGKEALLTLLEPPSWFGEIALFDGMPRTHHACADGATVLWHLPQEPLKALLDEDPSHWRHLGLLMALKLRLVFVGMEDRALLPADLRLARRLYLMAMNAPPERQHHIDIPQEQLALLMSMSRQTINQILKDLESRDVVRLAYGKIEIPDLERLRGAAGVSEHEARLMPRWPGAPGPTA